MPLTPAEAKKRYREAQSIAARDAMKGQDYFLLEIIDKHLIKESFQETISITFGRDISEDVRNLTQSLYTLHGWWVTWKIPDDPEKAGFRHIAIFARNPNPEL